MSNVNSSVRIEYDLVFHGQGLKEEALFKLKRRDNQAILTVPHMLASGGQYNLEHNHHVVYERDYHDLEPGDLVRVVDLDVPDNVWKVLFVDAGIVFVRKTTGLMQHMTFAMAALERVG